jgi:probable F420-dependent oxidoreductase
MRIGLMLPNPRDASRDSVLTVARTAERLGYDSVWTNSHTVVPRTFEPRYPYLPSGVPPWDATVSWADAMSLLAFVAGATERVRIGVTVVPVITTHPLTLAKQTATIDVLSNGRFELGVGAGWLLEEGAALGNPTDHRSARLEETVEVLRLAWTSPTFHYEGRFVRIPEVGINPHPTQGGALPMWIGGQGDAAVRIAARRDLGLFIWQQPPERVSEYAQKLRALKPGARLAASIWTPLEERKWDEQLDGMKRAGVDLLVLGRRYDGRTVSELERFASAYL